MAKSLEIVQDDLPVPPAVSWAGSRQYSTQMPVACIQIDPLFSSTLRRKQFPEQACRTSIIFGTK